jgi:thymidylate kinase
VGAAQLILIEGMIGSGKTTTAIRVGDWLTRHGENARVFCEGAADHPIRTRAEDRLRAAARPQSPGPDGRAEGTASVYADDQWRRLAERCLRDRQTIILESSFLQNSVMPAFIDDAPARRVNEIFTRIQCRVAPAEPLLVYLRPADIGAAIARVHRTRGEPWSSRNVTFVENSPWARRRNLRGQDAVAKLYLAWEPVVTQLYSRYPFPKIMVIDPQHDWQATLARICAAVRPSQRGRKPRPDAVPGATPTTPQPLDCAE